MQEGLAYGKAPFGDWTFKGTVQSNATDIPAHSDYSAYKLSRLTLTQSSLGLDDVVITNAPILLFSADRFSFTTSVYGGAPWAVTVYEDGHFSGAETLWDLLSRATTPAVTDPYNSFGPQWEGFELADGRHLYGWGFGPSSIQVAAVPEPSPLALLALGLAVVGACGRRLAIQPVTPR